MKQSKLPSIIAGENLRRLIRAHGLTQEQFAEDFGAEMGYERLDARTVRFWMSHGIVRIDTVQDVAAFFGISLLELLREPT